MKIISLTAENVKKLSVVQITPDGNLVQITGKNGQGKSSVLDAIWWALAGQSNIQSAPIRKDATEARITLDLGDIIVKRTFKRRMEKDDQGNERPAEGYTTSIIVENADGARFPSPQKMLDGLLGALSLDPIAFANAEPKAQFEMLKRFVPGVDFAAVDKANAADYEARTVANRRAKEARTMADSITVPPNLPDSPIDESALLDSIQKGADENTKIEQRKAARTQAERDMGDALASAASLREQAAKAVSDAEAQAALLIRNAKSAADATLARAAEADRKSAELKKRLAEAPQLPSPTDIAALRAQLTAAKDVNAQIAARARRAEYEKSASEHEAESKRLTSAMDKREADKRKAIAEAKLPIPNVEFGNGMILMNGVPFEQASDAEKLRASVAIAMATNPKLRVIRVRDGSLLDEDGIKLLAEMADAADCQVWMERVDSSGKIGFVLEDGHLKDPAPENKKAAA